MKDWVLSEIRNIERQAVELRERLTLMETYGNVLEGAEYTAVYEINSAVDVENMRNALIDMFRTRVPPPRMKLVLVGLPSQ